MPKLQDNAVTPTPPRRRLLTPRLSRDQGTRSIQIGVLGTIIVHVLFLWLASRFGGDLATPDLIMQSDRSDAARNFDIEIAPDLFEAEESPPNQFVEVNPDAPDNAPDQTQNFGAQNQQVAQEVPTLDGQSDSPAVEGQTDVESTALVSGDRSEPVQFEPAPQPSPEVMQEIQEALQEAVRQAQNPLTGFEEAQDAAGEGIGSNIVRLPDNPQPVLEAIEGSQESTRQEGSASGSEFRIDPTRPAPRPVLSSSNLRPAFVTERVDGTANMGVIAHNALRTEYGAYLSRIIETVDRQWSNNIRTKLQSGFSYPLAGSRVAVKFRLFKNGDVSIITVDGESTDTFWSRVTVDSVAERAPYGPWTDDMIAILGESQEITFTFHYQ